MHSGRAREGAPKGVGTPLESKVNAPGCLSAPPSPVAHAKGRLQTIPLCQRAQVKPVWTWHVACLSAGMRRVPTLRIAGGIAATCLLACGARSGEPNVNAVGGNAAMEASPSWTSAARPEPPLDGTNAASGVTNGDARGIGTQPLNTTPAASTLPAHAASGSTGSASFDTSPRAVVDGVDTTLLAGFAACTELGTPVAVTDDAAAHERMVGRWAFCAGAPIFAREHDGIQFNEDGTWAFLRYDVGGELQPQRGFDGGGKWTVSTEMSSFSMLLELPLGSDPMSVTLQENPTAIRTRSSVGKAAYVAVSEVNTNEWPAPIALDAGAFDAGSQDSTCGQPGDVIPTKTQEALIEHLVRRWRYCSGYEPFAIRHDGIEFNEDGTWAFLQSNAQGELQPMSDPEGSGTWTVMPNGDDIFQVNLTTSSGWNGAFFAFQEDPTAMRMETTGGRTDYVAAE